MNHLLAYVIFIYTFQERGSGSGQALLPGQGSPGTVQMGRGHGEGLQGPPELSPAGQPGLVEPPQQHREGSARKSRKRWIWDQRLEK